MRRTRRHGARRPGLRRLTRAAARVSYDSARHPAGASALTAVTMTAVVTAASTAESVSVRTVLTVAVVLGGLAAGSCAVVLIRLALRIHGRAHSFGPCRGAGFLGMGTAVAAVSALVAGLMAAWGHGVGATVAVQVGAGGAACSFVAGLLLLPGAAPTLPIRLRQMLDGTGVGSALFLIAWLLLLSPGLGSVAVPTGPAVLVGLVACIALALAAVTGMRAYRHRRAALACAGGSALVITGLGLPAVGQHGPFWFAVAGLALTVGPPLIILGARRADPSGTTPVNGPAGGLAAHPLLAVPVAAALAVTAYHAATGGRFDRVAAGVALLVGTAVAARETMAALDVRRYAQRLTAQHARFQALTAGAADVTMVLDPELFVRWQSPAAARRFGLSDQDVLHRPLADRVHPDDLAVATASLTAVLDGDTGGPDSRPVRVRLRDGFDVWRDTEVSIRDLRTTPEIGALVLHIRDIGDRAGLERRLDEAARTDPLTGLPNERRLHELAATRLATGARGALVVLTVHGLTGVNDLHGTAIGDSALRELGRRLAAGIEPGDVAARLGGDRFGVLCRVSALRAYPRAARLVASVMQPYDLSSGPVHLTADAGVVDLAGEQDAADAVRHAWLAADRAARRGGHGRVEAYDDGLAAALRRRTAIEQGLHDTINDGAFDLVYQPVLHLRANRPVATEALLRWRLPEFGAVPPVEIVAAAEELGCVADLDGRVLRRACRQLSRWRREGLDLSMSVNISPRELSSDALPLMVQDALRRNDVPAEHLTVELASRDLPDDPPTAGLSALRELGVRVALDHFGSGPMGLAQLPKLPIDEVKVDRSLFADGGPVLVDVVVTLGARLGFAVSAVGVETLEELERVRIAGCATAQGSMLAPVGHAEHVEAYLEEHRAPLM
jgi:diguanylate cyclase (GGDEF)-like protein/PAS domain S-box-containing protein